MPPKKKVPPIRFSALTVPLVAVSAPVSPCHSPGILRGNNGEPSPRRRLSIAAGVDVGGRVTWGADQFFVEKPKSEKPLASGRKLMRKATGVFTESHKLAMTSLYDDNTGPASSPDDTSTSDRKSETPPDSGVQISLVGRELKPHHFGPVFITKATIERQGRAPLGLTLCSAHQTDSSGVHLPNGTMVGAIGAGSYAEKCQSIAVDDKLVAINGDDVTRMTHEEVVNKLTSLSGTVKLDLARSTKFDPNSLTTLSLLQRGTGSVPAKLKKRGSGMLNKKGKSSLKSKGMSVKTLSEIVIHRHPNTNGLQIGVHGGFDVDQFPYVVTATHPRSPYLPLVEGGDLAQNYEMLSVEGKTIVGLRHREIIDLLKNSGEQVRMRVIKPTTMDGKTPRKITELFKNPAGDSETQTFLSDVRRAIYSWAKAVTTRPRGEDETDNLYQFVSVATFEETARNNGFLEWMLHANGYLYGIPIKPQPRNAVAPSNLLQQKHLAKSIEQLLYTGDSHIDVRLPTNADDVLADVDAEALELPFSPDNLRPSNDVSASIKGFSVPGTRFEYKATGSAASAKKRSGSTSTDKEPKLISPPKRSRGPITTAVSEPSSSVTAVAGVAAGAGAANDHASATPIERTLHLLADKVAALQSGCQQGSTSFTLCTEMQALLARATGEVESAGSSGVVASDGSSTHIDQVTTKFGSLTVVPNGVGAPQKSKQETTI